jgi:hypothetical protein
MNKKTVFIDTGAWFAIADKTDQFHGKATEILHTLVESKIPMVTSNLIVHETVMLLSRKVSKTAAVHFPEKIYADGDIEIIQTDEEIEQKAYKIFKRYTEQDFTIADCCSFVIMKENQIRHAFTFDKHFAVMKFIVE